MWETITTTAHRVKCIWEKCSSISHGKNLHNRNVPGVWKCHWDMLVGEHRERAWHCRECCALHPFLNRLQEPLPISLYLTKHWGFHIYIVWHYLLLACYITVRSLMTGHSVCQNCYLKTGFSPWAEDSFFQGEPWHSAWSSCCHYLLSQYCLSFVPSRRWVWKEGLPGWPPEELRTCTMGPWALPSQELETAMLMSLSTLNFWRWVSKCLSAMFMKEPLQCSHADVGTYTHTSTEAELHRARTFD